MRRSSHKEKVNRQEYANEKNKRYFACLANEPTSDSAREAFKRPAYAGLNVRTSTKITCDGCEYEGTDKIDDYKLYCARCKRSHQYGEIADACRDMYVRANSDDITGEK